MAQNSTQLEVLPHLRQQLARYGDYQQPADESALSTGCRELDQLFPGDGLRRGTVLEWLSPGPGSGVSLLALAAMRGVLKAGGALVLCDREASLSPVALAGLGIAGERVIVVRARDTAEHRWAIDQALRSPAVAVVWARAAKLDDKTSRRFQLAAERGGAIGVLIRPAAVRGQPTWADTQLLVTPVTGQPHVAWQVECTRARGPTPATVVRVSWEDETRTLRALPACYETHSLPVAARLVRAAHL